MNLGLGPHERLGVDVVGGNECVDVGYQLLARGERGAGQRFGCQDGEPDLDLVQPRRLGRGEVEVHVRVPLQPAIVLRLVGVEIVENDTSRR